MGLARFRVGLPEVGLAKWALGALGMSGRESAGLRGHERTFVRGAADIVARTYPNRTKNSFPLDSARLRLGPCTKWAFPKWAFLKQNIFL